MNEPPVIDNGCTEPACIELTPPGPPGAGEVTDDEYLINGVQYFTPCFNPNNPDEFIYTRISATPNPELIKYNIATKQETILLTPMSLGRADWGEQGWIIFEYTNDKIWKIREDGTQLMQASPYDGFSPEFGATGQYFLAGGYIPSNMTEGYRPVFDLMGNIVDSVKYNFEGNISSGFPFVSLDSTFQDGYFTYGDDDLPLEVRSGICRKHNDNTITLLNSNFFGSQIQYVAANSNAVYFTQFNGPLRKLDLTTLSTTIFKTGCNSCYYDHISMSPNGDKLLVEKVIQTRLDYYTVDVQHDIWLVDLNTCEATPILVGQ